MSCLRTVQVSCLTAEQFVKDVPELRIEGGVNDWVDGAVDIAEPRYHGDEGGSDVTWLTQHIGDMDDEERCPTGQKHPWDMETEGHIYSFMVLFTEDFSQLFNSKLSSSSSNVSDVREQESPVVSTYTYQAVMCIEMFLSKLFNKISNIVWFQLLKCDLDF